MCHGSQFLDTIQETSKNVAAVVAAAAAATAAAAVAVAAAVGAAADTEIDFSGLEGRSGRSIFLLGFWDHLLTQSGK